MGGFLTKQLNSSFKRGFYEIILEALIDCSNLMKTNCLKNNIQIENHEEKIRNHLLENYLENDDIRASVGLVDISIRFMPETLESYSASKNSYIGRADIKIVSSNWFTDKEDYYIVECKRIDGSSSLNKKYVEEGICRFVDVSPKYPSYHNKNIMFAFVVENIDIEINVLEIEKVHVKKIGSFITSGLTQVRKAKNSTYFLYSSDYAIKHKPLNLDHLFFDFSVVVK